MSLAGATVPPVAAARPRWGLVALSLLVLVGAAIGVRLAPLVLSGELAGWELGGEYRLIEPDGYFYAVGARDRLEGNPAAHPRPAADRGASIVAFAVARTTGLPLDRVFFFLPAVLGALVVVPLVLLFAARDGLLPGVVAGLVASTGWAFYYRSAPGYFSPEPLNVVFPLFAVLFLVRGLEEDDPRQGWGAFLVAALQLLWYPPSVVLFSAILAVLTLLAAVRRKEATPFLLLSLFAAGMAPIPVPAKLLVAFGAWLAHRRWPRGAAAWIPLAAGAAFVTGKFPAVERALRLYLLRRGADQPGTFHFHPVIDSVGEAAPSGIRELTQVVTGGPWPFLLLALAGALLLFRRRPATLLLLPMLAVGLASARVGMRFAMYAVPVAAAGLSTAVFFVAARIRSRPVRALAVLALVAPPLLASLTLMFRWRLQPFLSPAEQVALSRLRDRRKPDDYAVVFWELGYPTWYVGGVNTLTDGGRNHDDNFATSLVYTTDRPLQAANAARLFHERYHERLAPGGGRAEESIVAELFREARAKGEEPMQLLEAMARPEWRPPAWQRDLWLVLPARMLTELATIREFSNLDPATGKRLDSSVYECYPITAVEGNRIRFGDEGDEIDLAARTLRAGDKPSALRGKFWVVPREAGAQGVPRLQPPSTSGLPAFPLGVIVNVPRGVVVLADDRMLASLYVRMFLFRERDPALFEPFVSNDEIEIYRILR